MGQKNLFDKKLVLDAVLYVVIGMLSSFTLFNIIRIDSQVLSLDMQPHIWVLQPHIWALQPHIWALQPHIWALQPHIWWEICESNTISVQSIGIELGFFGTELGKNIFEKISLKIKYRKYRDPALFSTCFLLCVERRQSYHFYIALLLSCLPW